MSLSIFAFSSTGYQTALRVAAALGAAQAVIYLPERLLNAVECDAKGEFAATSAAVLPQRQPQTSRSVAAAFFAAVPLIFVGATGIAVRKIAPYVRDKRTDPPVLCLDERANFVIPLLSGHIGGANALAVRLADALGATAVVTTATDVNGKFSVDTWASTHDCAISDMVLAKEVSAAILEHSVPICSAFRCGSPLPDGLVAGDAGELGISIGYTMAAPFTHTLRLIPRVLRVGVGCRRGIPQENISDAISSVFLENNLDIRAISGVFSIDLKKDEPGLLALCDAHGWPLTFYSAAQLQAVEGKFESSAFVQSVTGVDNVCERAALLGADKLLVRKTAKHGVTVAVAVETWEVDFG